MEVMQHLCVSLFILIIFASSFTNLYILKVLIHICALGDIVALVEKEIRSKHIFTKPDFSECVQQTFVIVISHPATILNLPYHIANCSPRDTLQRIDTYY